MPELSVRRGNSNLTWALSSLGLADLFKPGFAQLYDVSDYKWLSVSGIIHKTHFDIRESGDGLLSAPVASAAPQTVGNNVMKNSLFSHSAGKPVVSQSMKHTAADPDVVSISIDKPFLYFVFDNVSGLVMVMGKFGREPVNYRLPI